MMSLVYSCPRSQEPRRTCFQSSLSKTIGRSGFACFGVHVFDTCARVHVHQKAYTERLMHQRRHQHAPYPFGVFLSFFPQAIGSLAQFGHYFSYQPFRKLGRITIEVESQLSYDLPFIWRSCASERIHLVSFISRWSVRETTELVGI